jgi:septal ring factor EnvC (AmiA/AmiB activator)
MPERQAARVAHGVVARARSSSAALGRAMGHEDTALVTASERLRSAGTSAGSRYGIPATPFRFLRGRLPLPAGGEVAQRFGVRPFERTGTVERHSGWSLRVAAGAIVRASATGVVVGRVELPGLDGVVVIDHGDGYHMVIAGLSSAAVTPGVRVDAGDAVGVAVGGARLLYFEVRDRGVPVDPASWMAPSGARLVAMETR